MPSRSIEQEHIELLPPVLQREMARLVLAGYEFTMKPGVYWQVTYKGNVVYGHSFTATLSLLVSRAWDDAIDKGRLD